jgi:site-specific DNA-cytosine methylase
MSASSSVAYKQFGNSVNVNVITHMANWLMSMV